jgi:hypothetical protein
VGDLDHSPAKSASESSAFQDLLDGIAGGIVQVRWNTNADVQLI